jgi:hypothetical protein
MSRPMFGTDWPPVQIAIMNRLAGDILELETRLKENLDDAHRQWTEVRLADARANLLILKLTEDL